MPIGETMVEKKIKSINWVNEYTKFIPLSEFDSEVEKERRRRIGLKFGSVYDILDIVERKIYSMDSNKFNDKRVRDTLKWLKTDIGKWGYAPRILNILEVRSVTQSSTDCNTHFRKNSSVTDRAVEFEVVVTSDVLFNIIANGAESFVAVILSLMEGVADDVLIDFVGSSSLDGVIRYRYYAEYTYTVKQKKIN